MSVNATARDQQWRESEFDSPEERRSTGCNHLLKDLFDVRWRIAFGDHFQRCGFEPSEVAQESAVTFADDIGPLVTHDQFEEELLPHEAFRVQKASGACNRPVSCRAET